MQSNNIVDFDLLYDSIDIGVCLYKDDMIILYINQYYANSLGVDKEMITGKRYDEIFGKHNQDIRKQSLELLNKDHVEVRREVSLGSNSRKISAVVSVKKLPRNSKEELLYLEQLTDITTFKNVESNLQEELIRHRQFLDTIPVPVYFIDNESKFKNCNQAFEKMVQLSREKIIDRMIDDVIPVQNRNYFQKSDRELLDNPGFITYEGRIDSNSNYKEVRFHKATFVDTTYEVKGVVGIILDITDIKEAEKALKQSEEKYKDIFENANDIIFLIDFSGVFIDVNRAGLLKYGYSPDEIKKLNFADIVEANHHKRVSTNMRARISGIVQKKPYELLTYNKSGEPLWIEVSGRLMMENGQPVGIQGIARDVTDRKKSEKELYLLENALLNIDEAIVITNSDAKIEYVNPAFELMTQYSKREVLGKNPSLLKSNEHSKEFYKDLWDQISTGKIWKGSFINKRKDGTLFEEETTISPVKDNNGNITEYVAVKRDVTERVMMEAQLRQSQKLEAIGTLAAGVAHEINTPMQFIMDNTLFLKKAFNVLSEYIVEAESLLHNSSIEKSQMVEMLAEIEKTKKVNFHREEVPFSFEDCLEGIDRVRKIIIAMKDFSHPGHNEKSMADINKAIESTAVITKNVWKYECELDLDLEKDLPPVFCSIDDINQVFLNLIVNATDAIVELKEMRNELNSDDDMQGRIIIRTRSEKNSVVITVKDNGTGIPEAIKDKVFQPLHRHLHSFQLFLLSLTCQYHVTCQP